MMWEDEPPENLAADNELVAFQHKGFWKPMDALRDKIGLEAPCGKTTRQSGKYGN